MNRASQSLGFRALILCCFFLSGATGLLYEVVWSRLLGGVLGNSHFSITVVVSVFMGGLAIGSHLGGRLADRSANPLRLYGWLTLLVAVSCLLLPLLLAAARPFIAWLYRLHDGEPEAPVLMLARIAISTIALILPTTFMGATLPALVRHFARRLETVGATVGKLYAVNTFGAVFGASFTGFIGIAQLGTWGCIALAVVVDVAIAAAVLLASRGDASAQPGEARADVATAEPSAAPTPAPSRELRVAIFAFAAVGFANMALQIGWTKALVLSIGNSTYAFSLIVGLFILGIAIGGALVSLVVDRWSNLLLALGLLIVATAVLVTATIPLLGYLPVFAARWFDSIEPPSYGKFLLAHLAMVSVVILPSTILMGTVFPVVGKIRTRAIERVGSAVGSAYFFNTLGSILGTLAAGFLFIPLFGRVFYTLYLAAGISLALGAAVVLLAQRRAAPVRLGVTAVLVAVVLVPAFLTRPHGVLGSTGTLWHPAVMSRGAYVYYPNSYYDREGNVRPLNDYVESIIRSNEVLLYTEGIHAPIAVVRSPTGQVAMRISGKVEASLSPEGEFNVDAPHQILAGHLPMILHPDPKDVLTLGLGGGVTLGTLTLYPVDSVDSLEISEEVIDAARDFFSQANRGALTNPIVRNVVGDGRNHLEYTTRTYDVITSVPSNPWIAGIGNLFTVEFFEVCRSRLRDGGVICNWIHKVNMRASDFRTVVRTFVEVFGEHAQLWDLGYDALLIGSTAPIRFDAERFEALLENREIAADLGVLGIRSAATFLRHFYLDADSMRYFLGRAGPLNRDAFPTLEFSCPYGLYGHRLDAFRALAGTKSPDVETAWVWGLPDDQLEAARRLREAFQGTQRAEGLWDQLRTQLGRFEEPSEIPMHPELLSLALEVAKEYGKVDRLLRRSPDPWLDERAYSIAQAPLGKAQERTLRAAVAGYLASVAGPLLERAAVATTPEEKAALLERAAAYLGESGPAIRQFTLQWLQLGRPERGLELLRQRVEATPRLGVLHHCLGMLAAASGDLESALSSFETALSSTDDRAERSNVRMDMGFALQRAGEIPRAIAEYESALEENPSNELAQKRLEALRSAPPTGR